MTVLMRNLRLIMIISTIRRRERRFVRIASCCDTVNANYRRDAQKTRLTERKMMEREGDKEMGSGSQKNFKRTIDMHRKRQALGQVVGKTPILLLRTIWFLRLETRLLQGNSRSMMRLSSFNSSLQSPTKSVNERFESD